MDLRRPNPRAVVSPITIKSQLPFKLDPYKCVWFKEMIYFRNLCYRGSYSKISVCVTGKSP